MLFFKKALEHLTVCDSNQRNRCANVCKTFYLQLTFENIVEVKYTAANLFYLT